MSTQAQRVGVFFGGRSSEHEVALRSAVFVIRQMPQKYKMLLVGISRNGNMFLLNREFDPRECDAITAEDLSAICLGKSPGFAPNAQVLSATVLPCPRAALPAFASASACEILNTRIDIAFPVIHGTNGEDGRFQGLFEMAEMAYAGCDIRASVLGIDKDIQKRLAAHGGVPIARYHAVDEEAWDHDKAGIVASIGASLGYPCFVKPNAQGSAVGVNRANNQNELEAAIVAALRYDTKALVEEAMTGTEVECAFLGAAAFPRITLAGEIAPKDFYSYEEKYGAGSEAALFIPARLDAARMEELRGLASKVASLLGLDGLSRIDFWNCAKTGKFYFNEVNTMPGLTSISMFPKLWEHEGVSGSAWIGELLERARQRAQRQAAFSLNP